MFCSGYPKRWTLAGGVVAVDTVWYIALNSDGVPLSLRVCRYRGLGSRLLVVALDRRVEHVVDDDDDCEAQGGDDVGVMGGELRCESVAKDCCVICRRSAGSFGSTSDFVRTRRGTGSCIAALRFEWSVRCGGRRQKEVRLGDEAVGIMASSLVGLR